MTTKIILTDEQEQHVAQLDVLTGRDYASYARQGEPFGEHLFWDEEAPEWHEERDGRDGRLYRTVVAYEMFGEVKTPEGWTRDATYDLGEGECYCAQSECNEGKPSPTCVACEGDGLVWLGDGWREVVYSAPEALIYGEEEE